MNGVITLSLSEADDVEREVRRAAFREPYRTLLGHFRHEVGHFYWDLLVEQTRLKTPFRLIFGDERQSYDASLQNYHARTERSYDRAGFISEYATSHPWEDWAETWAHYLHMVDTLETAASFRLSINESVPTKPGLITYRADMDFDTMLAEWTPLTCALNTINRSMGLSDLYPFIIPAPVTEKLKFIHRVILENAKK